MVLFVVHLDTLDAIVAEALDGRDAVAGVEPQLLSDLVVQRQRLVAGTQVSMGIDEPGHDGLAGEVDRGRPGRNLDVSRGAGRLDAAVGDDQRCCLDWRAPGAVNQPPASQDHGAAAGWLRERRFEGQRGQHQRRRRGGRQSD
jgi:hypothetical protein